MLEEEFALVDEQGVHLPASCFRVSKNRCIGEYLTGENLTTEQRATWEGEVLSKRSGASKAFPMWALWLSQAADTRQGEQ